MRFTITGFNPKNPQVPEGGQSGSWKLEGTGFFVPHGKGPAPLVYVGTDTANVCGVDLSSSTDTELVIVHIPAAKQSGSASISVQNFPGGQGPPQTQTHGDAFTYTAGEATWFTIAPAEATPGSLVYINGSGFNKNHSYTVAFGDTVVNPTKGPMGTGQGAKAAPPISPTGVWVQVPPGKGAVTVVVKDTTTGKVCESEGNDTFTYVGETTWTQVAPPQGAQGDLVHINGNGFNDKHTYKIMFGSQEAKITQGPKGKDGGNAAPPITLAGIWVTVPKGTGAVTVTVTDTTEGKLIPNKDETTLFTYKNKK
ncbi:MAG: IPT/TIG domain-containing protein [Chloroflexota bacterium]